MSQFTYRLFVFVFETVLSKLNSKYVCYFYSCVLDEKISNVFRVFNLANKINKNWYVYFFKVVFKDSDKR